MKRALVCGVGGFINCYGAERTWTGGGEKAPAAICRKVAEVEDGGSIEVWGDGTAVRSYTHVDDMVEGICMLRQSGLEGLVNIGCPQHVTVNELVATMAEVAGKRISIRHGGGPVGVQSRGLSNERIYSIGWGPQVFLREGIERTYPRIERQVLKARMGVEEGGFPLVQSLLGVERGEQGRLRPIHQ